MFSTRPFHREYDVVILERFMNLREIKQTLDMKYFPPTGFVTEWEGEPVCVGFMIKCDNGTVINDGILSDPKFSKDVRNAAVKLLREALYDEARKCGYDFVIAQTDQPKLGLRLLDQGYLILQENLTYYGRKLWPLRD